MSRHDVRGARALGTRRVRRPAVILATLDQREKTLRCLASLARVTYPPFDTVVWDNGSTDGTVAAVREAFPGVVAHHHPTNLGAGSGKNAGARLAIERFDSDFLVFLDNDTTVEPDFLRLLAAPFAEEPGLAQTTPKILMLGREDTLYGAAGCRIDFVFAQTNHIGHGEKDRGQYDRRVRCIPSGGCMLVPRDIFEELGGFDPVFDPYGPEDLDFGLRARRAGYHALFVPEAVVYHEPRPGKTFVGPGYSAAYARNKARLWMIFLRRHASAWDRARFYGFGAPIGVLRRASRELLRGNPGALSGLFRGALDSVLRRR